MLHILLTLALMQAAGPSQLTAVEVVAHMERADNDRLTALAGYTGMRRYRFENRRFKKRAEVVVRAKCASTGVKTFEVVEGSGSSFVRRQIIQRMIDAEREASEKGEREQTRITPQNYSFSLVGTDISGGRSNYVLDITPKTKNRFLIRGRIWVDAEEYAITRIEGSPAKNPSRWIKSVKVVHLYRHEGRFWMPTSNRSRAQVQLFGTTDVEIEYFDYAMNDVRDQASEIATPPRLP